MAETPKILLGIATVSPDRRFLESLPYFFKDAAAAYNIEIFWVWNKPLVDAQNEIADKFLAGDYTHLLFIEDDHWAFTKEMLDACFKPDAAVCGVSYRSRHFPFPVIPMLKSHQDEQGFWKYRGFNGRTGYHEVDLVGFGFTLIKREVFEKLEQPYFRLNWDGTAPKATDIDFCLRIQAAGFKIIGCYDHRVNHREITDEGVNEMQVNGILAKHSMFTRLHTMFLKKKTSNLNLAVAKEE